MGRSTGAIARVNRSTRLSMGSPLTSSPSVSSAPARTFFAWLSSCNRANPINTKPYFQRARIISTSSPTVFNSDLRNRLFIFIR